MSLTTLTGVVSGIRHTAVTEGVIGKNGGSVRTGQALAFRGAGGCTLYQANTYALAARMLQGH